MIQIESCSSGEMSSLMRKILDKTCSDVRGGGGQEECFYRRRWRSNRNQGIKRRQAGEETCRSNRRNPKVRENTKTTCQIWVLWICRHCNSWCVSGLPTIFVRLMSHWPRQYKTQSQVNMLLSRKTLWILSTIRWLRTKRGSLLSYPQVRVRL